MKNPERTREKILEESAALFNQKGYAGSSISDIMKATGLKKGGVYNHFGSKQELKIQAFRHSVQKVSRFLRSRILTFNGDLERLHAIPDTFVEYALHPVVAGGCPLLNTAIEADDADPALRTEAQKALDRLQRFFAGLFRKAQSSDLLDPDIDPEEEAIFLISSLEGGVMLSRLNGDNTYMKTIANQLHQHIKQITNT